IRFDRADVFVGNEGYSKELFVHGKTSDLYGSPLPYKNGQEIPVSMAIADGVFEAHLGDRVVRCTCKSVDKIHVVLRAGDYWSKGTTEFWDFHVTPLAPGTLQKPESKKVAAAESPSTSKTIFDIDAIDTDQPAKADDATKPNSIANDPAPEADAFARSVAVQYPA